MNNEVKIIPPVGFKIDRENSTLDLIKFKAIKTTVEWKDFGTVSGYYITTNSTIESYNGNSTLLDGSKRDTDKNIFPTKEEAEACLALSQLCQWRDKYNEGWKPDWNDTNQIKHVIEFASGVIYVGFYNKTQRPLAFKTKEIRNKFVEDFNDLILIAKPLL